MIFLPTEAERLKAEKDLKEAEERELGIEDPAEKSEQTEKEDPAVSGGDNPAAEEEAEKAAEDVRVLKREMTRMEAETTPEALKVRRAKARAAYQMSKAEVTQQIIDVKVN